MTGNIDSVLGHEVLFSAPYKLDKLGSVVGNGPKASCRKDFSGVGSVDSKRYAIISSTGVSDAGGPGVNTREAKDFLVEQAVQQAGLENESLSDIEKRMMYFVENDATSCEDPLALNDEFEAKCDTAEYEAKMSRLLHHAYKRLKADDPERVRRWQEAMRLLSKGDHYLPVLWEAEFPSELPIRDFLKPFGVGLLIAVVIAIVTFLVVARH